MPTTTMEKYQKSNDKLEQIREESREARKALVDAIMCDNKDVLSSSDLEAIEQALRVFRTVHVRLLRAWGEDGDALARL